MGVFAGGGRKRASDLSELKETTSNDDVGTALLNETTGNDADSDENSRSNLINKARHEYERQHLLALLNKLAAERR